MAHWVILSTFSILACLIHTEYSRTGTQSVIDTLIGYSPKAIRGDQNKLILISEQNLSDVWVANNRVLGELDAISKLLAPHLGAACKQGG